MRFQLLKGYQQPISIAVVARNLGAFRDWKITNYGVQTDDTICKFVRNNQTYHAITMVDHLIGRRFNHVLVCEGAEGNLCYNNIMRNLPMCLTGNFGVYNI